MSICVAMSLDFWSHRVKRCSHIFNIFSLDAHGKYVVAADDNDNHPHGVVLMKNSIFIQLVMVKKQLAYVIFRMYIFVCIMPIT